METTTSGKIQRVSHRHAPEVSKQTGFPSAATHYMEAPIDLNKELAQNQDATFFIRVEGEDWKAYQVFDGDVLIIDRSLKPFPNSLLLAIVEGEFTLRKQEEGKEGEDWVLWGVVTYIIHQVL